MARGGGAGDIHEAAWSAVIERAKADPYYRYAIYASRSLAVKHPEVYLKGDKLFIDLITSEIGYGKAYSIKNVHDEYLYGRNMAGPPFSFAQVDFNKYSRVKAEGLYPSGYPFLPYLDRRLLPIASTLKLAHNSLTELELAEQCYFSLREKSKASDPYIIYCDDESAYVYDDARGRLIRMGDLKGDEAPAGNPILIFNSENVWYPLMGRDDRSKDPILNDLISRYSRDIQLPKITEFESRSVSMLKKVTELGDSRQALMAKICAAHTEGARFSTFFKAWRELGIPTTALGLFQEIYRRANYLSPITAYLAWISEGCESEAGLSAMTYEYLKYAATPGYSFAHGHTWTCSLVGQTIDECYRTQAGHCVWQSASLAAVLDLLGVDNYIMEGRDDGGTFHTTVYVPKYDLILNNGRIRERRTVLSRGPQGPYSAIRYISHGGKWANPVIGAYSGSLSPKEVADMLDHLKSIHNDDIKGLGWGRIIPYDQLIRALDREQASWKPIELPGSSVIITITETAMTTKEEVTAKREATSLTIQETKTSVPGEVVPSNQLLIGIVVLAIVLAIAFLALRKRAK
jgi:hypothetical protein